MDIKDPTMIQFMEELDPPSWGFWDETQTEFFAGFVSEEDAKRGLQQYLNYLETGEPYCEGYPHKLYWTK